MFGTPSHSGSDTCTLDCRGLVRLRKLEALLQSALTATGETAKILRQIESENE